MTYESGSVIHTSTRVSRRSFIGSLAGLGALATLTPAFAQIATPASQSEGDSDALEVLKAAGSNVVALDTFTFSLETTAGKSTVFPGVELVSVEGAVRRPMDLSATLNVKALTQTMEIGAVAVDGEFYVQDPLSGGSWQNLGSAPEISTMINPDWMVMAAVNLIQDAAITSQKDDVTLIEGYINLTDSMGAVEGADLEQIKQFLASGPVDVAFWIDNEDRITAAELYGPFFASESADVEKRIEFGGFNEPVDIEKPAI